MGNLPISRTITLSPSDPLPSGIINELQDAVIGLHTATEFLPIGPGLARLDVGVTMAYSASDDRLLKLADTSTQILVYPIPLPRGRKIVGVRVHVIQVTGVAGGWAAKLQKTDMTSPAVSRSNVVQSIATNAKQVIVLTGITPTAIAADESWSVIVSSPGGASCDRYSLGVEIEHTG